MLLWSAGKSCIIINIKIKGHYESKKNHNCFLYRLWREVATYELKRRKPVVRLTSYDTSFENCDVDTHFHNTLINKPMLAMFFNSAECEPRGKIIFVVIKVTCC